MKKPLAVFALIFAALLGVNASHLADPPYWDAITGVYSQGIWLAENRLDFAGLLREPGYLEGGPNVNVFLVYAPLFALLSLHLEPPSVFLALHLLNLLLAALCAAACFALLRKRVSLWPALAWVAAGTSNPIWSGQAASLYLDVPAACLAGLSLGAFSRRAPGRAAAFCLAGYFVKESLLILAMAFAVFGLLCVIPVPRLRSARGTLRGRDLALLGVPLPLMLLLERLKPSTLDLSSDLPSAVGEFIRWAWLCFPDLAVWTALAALLFARAWISKRDTRDAGLLALLGLLVGGFWLATLIFYNPLVRYTTFVLFPTLTLLALLLRSRPRTSLGLASAIALFGVLNQQGSLLPRLPFYASRSGDFLERSREFLRDLEGNRAVCAELEADYFHREVVAKYPFVQMLTLPALGYVSSPLPRVFAAGRPARISPATPFRAGAVSPDALYVFSPNIFEASWAPSLRPRRRDAVLFIEPSGLAQPVVVYQRRSPEPR